MTFRTTEISDPRFESENLRFITVKSANLKARGDILLFHPPGSSQVKIPLIILLHGVYGSSWAWALKAGVHRTALALIEKGTIGPMAIAMPSDGLWGDGSGYLSHEGGDFEKWIVDDVPAAVQEAAQLDLDENRIFISGLSMGGFGALRLGVKYQDRFAGISAHSSITAIDQLSLFVEEPVSEYLEKNSEEAFVWDVVKNKNHQIPPLRFDCGTEDHLIEHNRKLHRQLQEAGIEHDYQEYPGGHDWDYWEEHVVESLLFFDQLC